VSTGFVYSRAASNAETAPATRDLVVEMSYSRDAINDRLHSIVSSLLLYNIEHNQHPCLMFAMNHRHDDDDMQFTPPSAVRKRRFNDGNAMDQQHPAFEEPSAHQLWQQAFKRLRVNDQATDPETYAMRPPYSNPQDVPSHQSTSSFERVPLTPPPKLPANHPPDTDFKNSNHYLGQLHRERRLREQEESRRLSFGSAKRERGNGHVHMSPLFPRGAMECENVERSNAPSSRRRNVVYLHTDSKLE
jgi:hypothetical protein